MGTGSSNLRTDSQPSYNTDSASAAARSVSGVQQQPAQQLAQGDATSPAQTANLLLDTAPTGIPAPNTSPDPTAAPHATNASNVATAANEVKAKSSGQQNLPSKLQGSLSSGSSPPPVMTTRKRPREPAVPSSAKQAAVNVPAEMSSQAEGTSQPDALDLSPRPRRAKKQADQPDEQAAPQQKAFKSLDLIEQVAVSEIVQLAEEHSVVWCRVKGFPAWPVSS